MRRWTTVLSTVALLAAMIPAFPALAQEEPPPPPPLKINEVDYDQPSTDSAEFVEIFNAGTEPIDLSGLRLDLINGSDGALYVAISLTGILAPGDFYVVCANGDNTPECDQDLSPDTNLVQNGAPDALAIVEAETSAIIDTLSYEGDVTGFTEGTGATADDGGTDFLGLSRVPDGADTESNNADFTLRCITPGAANSTAQADCPNPNPPDPDPDPVPTSTALKINEIDYDQDSTDTAEFLEIYNSGADPVDLSAYRVDLVNGNGGAVYDEVELTGTLAAGDFYVLCLNEATTPECDVTAAFGAVQNGSPDAVAIVELANGAIVDTLSYEGDTVAPYTEGSGAGLVDDPATNFAGLSRITDGVDTDVNNVDFALRCITPGAANSTATTECPDVTPSPPVCTEVFIYDIQGAAHTSPLLGQQVCANGIVTAVDSGAGFYLQDVDGDGDIATSDAVFVFDRGATPVAVGDNVTVDGTVSEFTAAAGNLSTTQISVASTTVNSSGNEPPDSVVIGSKGRKPPTDVIEDDAFGSFDPEDDGLDFMESLEAMRVTVDSPTTVAGTSQFGELYTLPKGVRATQDSRRGTLNISPDDYNPERVQIDPDSGVFDMDAPIVDTGARLSDVTGVVGYAFGFYEVIPTEEFSVEKESRLRAERTRLKPGPDRMTIASYNVLNLDPNDGDGDTDVADGRFTAVATDIVRNLRSPDIVALQEIQDNSGEADDGVTAANETLQMLVDEIAALGGPNYQFIDNPYIGDNTSGGAPGANIRVAFLWNPERVDTVGGTDSVVDPTDQQTNPANPFWDTRPPLVQKFEFERRDFVVVNNHFASKSGSSPLYGTLQNSTERQEDPAVNGSLDQRRAQAEAVNAYLAASFDADANVVTLGDFNEFEFISPLLTLSEDMENLTLRQRPDERYSYNFEGNSQSLDHILVSENLSPWTAFDPVHLNSEFAATDQRSSDHDPLVASINVKRLPQKPKPAYTLFVLHNNDGESDLLPDESGAGSISRFGELLDDERRDLDRGRKQGVVSLTAGDNFLASPEFSASLDKGAPFYDSIALDRIDYDVYTIGNHEFDFGPDVLAEFINGITRCEDTPFLSANLIFDAEPALAELVDRGCIEGSTVLRVDGRRIGIIGLTTPELREVSSPGDVEILTNLAEIANAEAQEMTDSGIEIILLASHLQNLDNEVELAASLSNIDAIIGGGGGERLLEERTAVTQDGSTIPIVTVPGDYFDLGRLELGFDRDGTLIEFDWDLVPVTGDLDQDRYLLHKVENPVADYVAALDEEVIATGAPALNGVRADVRTRETNLGNLMADSFISVVEERAPEFGVTLSGPIVGLQNGGGIRNDSIIGPGDITLLDTFDIAPFTNFVSVIPDVAPADLVAAVEHGLSLLPAAEGLFGHWSGLVVTYDPAAPAGSRIVNLTVNGVPYVVAGALQGGVEAVDVATIDFLALGNDGYDMFEGYGFTRLGTSYQQALAGFLAVADLTDPEYQPRPEITQRTRIIPTS
ncbi:MAG TPA: lamin tail domain-containing protein [Acidimicrobiia bacterium]|nr:lamin tail domain-containing protein [Acidimicrobiia bacterium]